MTTVKQKIQALRVLDKARTPGNTIKLTIDNLPASWSDGHFYASAPAMMQLIEELYADLQEAEKIANFYKTKN